MSKQIIRIIAPSSAGEIDPDNIKSLEALGFDVQVDGSCGLQHGSFAGTPQERADALMAAFCNQDVDIVMAARGGNGAIDVLPLLDYEVLRMRPKPFVGFSDSTAILNALYARAGLQGVHGPTLSYLNRVVPSDMSMLSQVLQGIPQQMDLSGVHVLRRGCASGPLIGGNLSVFTSLVGTPYMPDTRGCIVFLEDVGDELSRYGRMLSQLRVAGVFDGVAGLIFGQLDCAADTGRTPYGFELKEVIEAACTNLSCPIVMNVPFGHSEHLPSFAFGKSATLDSVDLSLTF